MDCSMPGLSVLHHLPEFVQTHVYPVSDVIQPSHSLLFSSPPALNLSQHQSLFQRVGTLHQVATVLELPPSPTQWKKKNHHFSTWLLLGREQWSPGVLGWEQETGSTPETTVSRRCFMTSSACTHTWSLEAAMDILLVKKGEDLEEHGYEMKMLTHSCQPSSNLCFLLLSAEPT